MTDSKSCRAKLLPADCYHEILRDAATRAQTYLRWIQERHVGVRQEGIANLPALGGPLPLEGEDPGYILQLLDEVGSSATVASMGRRFFGGVIGAPCLPRLRHTGWPTPGIKT